MSEPSILARVRGLHSASPHVHGRVVHHHHLRPPPCSPLCERREGAPLAVAALHRINCSYRPSRSSSTELQCSLPAPRPTPPLPGSRAACVSAACPTLCAYERQCFFTRHSHAATLCTLSNILRHARLPPPRPPTPPPLAETPFDFRSWIQRLELPTIDGARLVRNTLC